MYPFPKVINHFNSPECLNPKNDNSEVTSHEEMFRVLK